MKLIILIGVSNFLVIMGATCVEGFISKLILYSTATILLIFNVELKSDTK